MTTHAMNDTDLMTAIATERRDLAGTLAGLAPAAWDTPSLCAGWRVREVVAHMTMPFRYSPQQFGQEMAEAHGDFDKMADRAACRDAEQLPAAELVRMLRENENFRWEPPGGGLVGALTHDAIHGLDIAVPLGTGRRVPGDSVRTVLDTMTRPGAPGYFGTDLTGVQLVAGDMDWSYGAGPAVSGLAQDLALVLFGRKLPAGQLHGELSARFTAP
jgi:uncharacterized protein (TIGR03083 family)